MDDTSQSALRIPDSHATVDTPTVWDSTSLALTPEEVQYFDTLGQSDDVVSRDAVITEQLENMFQSESIRCIRCRRQSVTYRHQQTRSADEGMTTFFTCTFCNHQWKD